MLLLFLLLWLIWWRCCDIALADFYITAASATILTFLSLVSIRCCCCYFLLVVAGCCYFLLVVAFCFAVGCPYYWCFSFVVSVVVGIGWCCWFSGGRGWVEMKRLSVVVFVVLEGLFQGDLDDYFIDLWVVLEVILLLDNGCDLVMWDKRDLKMK